MSEGSCRDDTHHRGLVPIDGQLMVGQRFAIDFYKLDDQYRTWIGDPRKLDSYLSYRQPIIAAAAGTVVRAEDGLPNSTALPKPPPIPPIDGTVGNHVIVEIGPGTYVLYTHMDPRSVKVRVGQKVETGQELGLIGTSGNSTTPHVHFQLLSTPTFFPSISLPYVFDQFDLLGRVPVRLWDDNLALEPTGKLPFKPDAGAGPHQNELPLDRAVVRFTGTQ
jgi:murein DD-endopeptidase MepM/ murein hydrolase activator NlpD